jgi:hypothetical protein
MDDNNHIDFNAPATLRKWPSIKNERARAADGPYLIVDGTLDDCIRQFMAKPTSQHHLYEIHTAPQGELVSAVLSGIHILEIVRLRDGGVAELVGIEGGVVSGVTNLESSGVEASDWRPRHDEQYHEA